MRTYTFSSLAVPVALLLSAYTVDEGLADINGSSDRSVQTSPGTFTTPSEPLADPAPSPAAVSDRPIEVSLPDTLLSKISLAPLGKTDLYDDPRQSAPTPPMGWAPWNQFGMNMSEKVLRDATDALSSSYLPFGYKYLAFDEAWYHDRDPVTRDLHMDTRKIFDKVPRFSDANTLRPLVNYIHSKGILAGMYTDLGRNTCGQMFDSNAATLDTTISKEASQVGIYDDIRKDIKTFIDDWDFDYIKVDGCGAVRYFQSNLERYGLASRYNPLPALTTDEIKEVYKNIGAAILSTEKYKTKPIWFSAIGTWGENNLADWAKSVANSWRTSGDISPTWDSMLGNYNTARGREFFAGPGHWNDIDMMEVGVNRGATGRDFYATQAGDVTRNEFLASVERAKAHFAVWSIMASPLLLGFDLKNASDDVKKIVNNKDIIAVNQDPLGNQATVFSANSETDVLVKSLANRNERAVVLFNKSKTSQKDITVTWNQLHFKPKSEAKLFDLWNNPAAGTTINQGGTDSYTVTVPAQSARMFKLVGTHALVGENARFLSEMPGMTNLVWGPLPKGKFVYPPVADRNLAQGPIKIAGINYSYGITTVNSNLQVSLKGKYKRFKSDVGIDDHQPRGYGSVIFKVYGDGKLLFSSSKIMASGALPQHIDIGVEGVSLLELVADPTTDGFDYDEAVWANATIE